MRDYLKNYIKSKGMVREHFYNKILLSWQNNFITNVATFLGAEILLQTQIVLKMKSYFSIICTSVV